MKFRNLKFACLAIGCALSCKIVVANENGCLLAEDLISLSAEQLGVAQPCDYIGAYFLLGLGQLPDNSLAISGAVIDEDYGYYLYFRRYLYGLEQESIVIEDNYALLLLGLAILPQPDFSIRDDIVRANYYSSFALTEYWDRYDELLPETTVYLRDMVILFNDGRALKNMHQVRCFIQYDIPTIDPELVLDSDLYNSCLGDD